MQLSPYFHRRPPMDLKPETVEAFERLYTEYVENGEGEEIPYTLPVPKWQFLCYLCDNKGVLVHGSGNPGIEEFEPRKSNDTQEFGNRRAVYAASDAIWSMYFAILDREHYVTSLNNASFRVVEEDGTRSDRYYFFSINEDALPHHPWVPGTIYILPRDTFEQQEPLPYRGVMIEIDQWASEVPVRPLAKVHIEPGDFPFLAEVRGHDPKTIFELATNNPEGFPWLDE